MIPEVLLSNGLFYIALGCLFLLVALALRDIARILIKWLRSFYRKIMFYILFDPVNKSAKENIRVILRYDPLEILKGGSK